jgi:hypothetical protein
VTLEGGQSSGKSVADIVNAILWLLFCRSKLRQSYRI